MYARMLASAFGWWRLTVLGANINSVNKNGETLLPLTSLRSLIAQSSGVCWGVEGGKGREGEAGRGDK